MTTVTPALEKTVFAAETVLIFPARVLAALAAWLVLVATRVQLQRMLATTKLQVAWLGSRPAAAATAAVMSDIVDSV